jgi:hypothetical protein
MAASHTGRLPRAESLRQGPIPLPHSASIDDLCQRSSGSPRWRTGGACDEAIGSMTTPSNDRHVLVAAVGANAEVIVTFNVADFPETALKP